MIQDKPRLLFGYARVSTEEQRLDLQIDALLKYGVERDRIFTDKASGASTKGRPGFRNALKAMRPGASLVVWNIDRLGRDLSELIQTADLLQKREAELVSLTQQIDTSTATGKLIFHVFGMLAEFERNMISDRTKAGLAARKKRGQNVGRKKSLQPDTELWDLVVSKVREGIPFVKIAEQIDGLGKSTLYNNSEALRAAAAIAEQNELVALKGSDDL
ncbi:recombinase family protein [Epibacterium ulvae]|uniref:recombinase family protein n=1 Tax=Epibacterium ulvae TaxID=1156985 RepID=UPI0024917C48|nr:recombinase family protein [Epibacterium ulvae]